MSKFYFQRVDIPSQAKVDLEESFKGMFYKQCKGLRDKGKRKDVYIENYADADGSRVWQSDNVVREATEIEFEFYFTGVNRGDVYDSFYNYIKNGEFIYYDTERLRQVRLILKDSVEPDDDLFKGSNPFILIPIKFMNLWGESKKCDIDGKLV